jgi:hypothetical protein
MANYQRVSVQSLRYSAVITDPVEFDIASGTVIVDYTDAAFYYIDVLNPSATPFVLNANQVHLSNNLQVNADYNVIGTIYTEDSDIYGTGDIYGSGDVV